MSSYGCKVTESPCLRPTTAINIAVVIIVYSIETMDTVISIIFVIVLVVFAILLACTCTVRGQTVVGGARRKLDYTKSPHIVIDTLNLTHWITPETDTKITPDKIVATIDATADILKNRHPGRVMYVMKDRDSRFNTQAARDLYKAAADRNKVYIYIAERYVDPPKGVTKSDEHSALGRDDFFIALLTRKWRCAALTEDWYRDFDSFRATLQPFHVYEFAFWRDGPYRDYIRPESEDYGKVRRPRMVRFSDYFEELAKNT